LGSEQEARIRGQGVLEALAGFPGVPSPGLQQGQLKAPFGEVCFSGPALLEPAAGLRRPAVLEQHKPQDSGEAKASDLGVLSPLEQVRSRFLGSSLRPQKQTPANPQGRQLRLQGQSLIQGLAGLRRGVLVINLPGSPKAIAECLDAVFAAVPDCVDLIGGPRIETDPTRVAAFRPHD
jgi:hypothetical protein